VTCIVGIASGGRVVIGGDTAGVSGHDLQIRADTKVFTVGEYAMGFTSSFRMGQLLRYSFTAPPPDSWDVDRFMATTFVSAARQCLRDGGFLGKDSSGADEGGTFLVGVRGLLYRVASDFQMARTVCGYDAVGSGSSYALGSLHTSTAEPDLETRVRLALEAADANTTSVSAPFAYAEPTR